MELLDLVGSYAPQGVAGLVAGLSAWATTKRGLSKAIRRAVRAEVAPFKAELKVLSERVETLEANGHAHRSISRPGVDE